MADYQGKYTGAQVDALLDKAGTAVQQVAGKGLSTNDYTNADKGEVAKVAQLALKVGELTELETTEKTDLVGAINEVAGSTSDINEDISDLEARVSALEGGEEEEYIPYGCVRVVLTITQHTEIICGGYDDNELEMNFSKHFESLEIDGNIVEESDLDCYEEEGYAYTFDELGTHTLLFKLTDPTTILTRAFMNCNFDSICFSKSVSKICNSAFSTCNIQAIDIDSIEEYVKIEREGSYNMEFQNLLKYTIKGEDFDELEIPSGVTDISSYSFYRGKNIKTIILPSTIKSVGSNVFSLCSEVTKIYCYSTIPPSLTTTSWGAATNVCGRTTSELGTNTLYVPSTASGYDATWSLYLMSASTTTSQGKVVIQGGFTASYTL